MTCRVDPGWSGPGFGCICPRVCLLSKSGRGGIGKGSGLGEVVLATSGVGQGKESSEEWSLSGMAWLVVYGVCAAWSDRLVGIGSRGR